MDSFTQDNFDNLGSKTGTTPSIHLLSSLSDLIPRLRRTLILLIIDLHQGFDCPLASPLGPIIIQTL